MRINDIRALYDYNAWANARLLDTAARVPAEQFATAALGACNLRDPLTHLIVLMRERCHCAKTYAAPP